MAGARADPRSVIQRLVSYLVWSTPPGNVRVSTRFRFTQLSRAVKNGVPPPSRTLRDLMTRMGHDSMRAALIYQHKTQGADRKIADRLEALIQSHRDTAGDAGQP